MRLKNALTQSSFGVACGSTGARVLSSYRAICIYKILHPTLLTRNDKYAAQVVPLLFNAINERQRFATSRILARRQSHSQIPEINDSSTVKRGTERPLRGSRIQWR